MNEKLAKVKNAVKTHATDIAFYSVAATTVTALSAFMIYVIKNAEEAVLIKMPADAMTAYKDGSLKTFTTENDDYTYQIISKNN